VTDRARLALDQLKRNLLHPQSLFFTTRPTETRHPC
jgi:hypothetical protein